MSYTAKDLASELGVSQATVSLALNNKPGISQERRNLILQKAQERGLIASKKQTPLFSNISFVVFRRTGVMVSNSPFFSLLLDGASNAAYEFGYNLVMTQLNCLLPADEQVQQIRATNSAGLIIFATEALPEDLALMQSIGLPFVIVDNTEFCDFVDTICINNRHGISSAFQYLYDLGHRRIGFFKSKSEINSFSERLNVYKQCMQEKHLKIVESSIIPISYMGSDAQVEIEPFLRHPDFPTAFLSDNDFIATSAKQGLQSAGLDIPGDVSIIGFDNREIGEIYHPTLTSIALPTDFFGRISVEILLARIRDLGTEPRPPVTVSISGKLVVRESTASPRK